VFKNFINRFFVAQSFFTKIPVPVKYDYSKVNYGDATLLLPLIGWIVSGLAAIVFVLLQNYLPLLINIVIALLIITYLTSSLHEDGLADFFDGFAGGWTKEKILSIMKDSHIGTYGVLSLIFSVGLKIILLLNIPQEIIPVTLIIAHSFSRGIAVSFMYDLDYARIEDSKAKNMVRKITLLELLFVLTISSLPLLLLNNYWIITIIPIVYLLRLYLKHKLKKWIGGYTGDCLGAAQQLYEILIYFITLILYYNNLIMTVV